MKQYAIEGGPFGIRSNAVNADRIRTALLDPVALAERARARGLSPDDYYRAIVEKIQRVAMGGLEAPKA